jgi:hypothetical protein
MSNAMERYNGMGGVICENIFTSPASFLEAPSIVTDINLEISDNLKESFTVAHKYLGVLYHFK